MGVPTDQEPRIIAALKTDISANSGHLDTGIFGTQFFFETLADHGMNDLAYEAMNQHTRPSYGWWVEQGATTTWEGWGGNGSRNHPMFGGGLVWFYRKLAGMNSDSNAPGYKHIVFRPEPVGDISFVKYSNQTVYGTTGVRWEKKDGHFSMDVTVPVGSTATVYVPVEDSNRVSENGQKINGNANVSFQRTESGYAIYSVASGEYHFTAK
jgi:alpha-L-rhamnosidase